MPIISDILRGIVIFTSILIYVPYLLLCALFSSNRNVSALDYIDSILSKNYSVRTLNYVVLFLNHIGSFFPIRWLLTAVGRQAGVDRHVIRRLWFSRPEWEVFLTNILTEVARALLAIISLPVTAYRYFSKQEKKESKECVEWENWVGSQKAVPLDFYRPGKNPAPKELNEKTAAEWAEHNTDEGFRFKLIKEIQEKVRQLQKDNFTAKCVASGHALSDIAVSRDCMIETKGLTNPQRLANQEWIKPAYRDGFEVEVDHAGISKEKHYLFETGAGTKIKLLNHVLGQHGLALQNMGGTDVQGFMGAAATATHGSGIGIGSYSDMIRSMVVIKADSSVIRLEPNQGITDPDLYKASDEYEFGIRLLQDDQLFYSMTTCIGCMGIVFAVTLEVLPSYNLYEERRMHSWTAVRKRLVEEGRDFVNSARHFNILVNPFITEDKKKHLKKHAGENMCLITKVNYAKGLEQETAQNPNAPIRKRNFLTSVFAGLRFASIFTVWTFNRQPEAIPGFLSNSLHRLQDSSDSSKAGGFSDISYKVLDQGLGTMREIGYAIEVGFEIAQLPEVVDHICMRAQQWAEKYNQYLCAPISLRFVKASPSYLSPAYGRDVCMIEIIVLKGVTASDDLLIRLEAELVKKFNARPHWGLNMGTLTREQVEMLYPRFADWESAFNQMDPDGLFSNSFTSRLGLGRSLPTYYGKMEQSARQYSTENA